jgi:hypothetical protein
MPRRVLPGTRLFRLPKGRVSATTFVELVVTILLLVLFAAIAFPILWSSARANTAHSVETAAQRARLSVATLLPRLTEEVRPPYWENQGKVFQDSANEWKAFYRNGKESDFLIVRKEGESRLRLVTSDTSFLLDNLPELSVDWWKKKERIVGITVQWKQGVRTVEFHAAWGSFLL